MFRGERGRFEDEGLELNLLGARFPPWCWSWWPFGTCGSSAGHLRLHPPFQRKTPSASLSRESLTLPLLLLPAKPTSAE